MDQWDDDREVVFDDEPPVLPDQAYPETGRGDAGPNADDDRLLRERPPHWD